MSDQERCPTCGSDKKEAQWCRICKAPYQDGGICVRSWLPKTHTFSHCSHPWHESAPSSGPYRVNCYVKGHEGGSQCKDCLAPSSVAEQPQPIKWKRQESCPECDGDGCANCTVEQPSREQAVQADTLLGVFTSGDGAIAAKMFKELTPATVWEGMNRIADYVNRRPREQAVEGLVEALAAKARELLDEFVRARRVHHLDAADFRDAFKPVVAHYEASRGERQ